MLDSFSDRDGDVVDPATYGMPNWPKEALITATFTEQGSKTKFTLRHAAGNAPATDRDNCRIGWSESLDRLAEYLSQDRPR